MNLKLGEKIKQLRMRDGRRQEDLAIALRVSPQAISRWEANGGYPDMELVPAIANYFHVSIDSLFGYQNDREEKINGILGKADEMIEAERPLLGRDFPTDNLEKCVELLRNATTEFPNEPRILIKLGKALHMLGWNKKSAKVNYDEKLGVYVEDVSYNTDNVYWYESLQIYEKVLLCNVDQNQRDEAIVALCALYSRMGNYDKAKEIANKQNSLGACREILLATAITGEEQVMYRGEEIIALISRLQSSVISTSCLIKAFECESVRQILLSILEFQEKLFGNSNCGRKHLDMGYGWLYLAERESKYGEMKLALEYFDKGFEHYNMYNNRSIETEYPYDSPLLSRVKEEREDMPGHVDKLYFEKVMQGWSDDFCNELRKNPKYAICFE